MGSIFVEIVVHLMLMHITDSKTQPTQRFLVLLPIVLLLVHFFAPQYESNTLIGSSLFAFLYTATTLYKICIEVSTCLGIYVFKIGHSADKAV